MPLEVVINVINKELENVVSRKLWHGFVPLSLSDWFCNARGKNSWLVKFFVLLIEGLHQLLLE